MDLTSLLLVVAVVVANVLGVGMLIPQTNRILRQRNVDGVSAEWIGMGVAVNAGWLLYAWNAAVWGLVGVSAGGLILYLAMALGVRRLDITHFRRSRTTAFIILTALGCVVAFGQESALGLALAALFTVQFAPAAWSAWTSPTITGISPTTWILAFGEAAIWTACGAVIDDRALLLGGAGASTMSAVVLVRLWAGATLVRTKAGVT